MASTPDENTLGAERDGNRRVDCMRRRRKTPHLSRFYRPARDSRGVEEWDMCFLAGRVLETGCCTRCRMMFVGRAGLHRSTEDWLLDGRQNIRLHEHNRSGDVLSSLEIA